MKLTEIRDFTVFGYLVIFSIICETIDPVSFAAFDFM